MNGDNHDDLDESTRLNGANNRRKLTRSNAVRQEWAKHQNSAFNQLKQDPTKSDVVDASSNTCCVGQGSDLSETNGISNHESIARSKSDLQKSSTNEENNNNKTGLKVDVSSSSNNNKKKTLQKLKEAGGNRYSTRCNNYHK